MLEKISENLQSSFQNSGIKKKFQHFFFQIKKFLSNTKLQRPPEAFQKSEKKFFSKKTRILLFLQSSFCSTITWPFLCHLSGIKNEKRGRSKKIWMVAKLCVLRHIPFSWPRETPKWRVTSSSGSRSSGAKSEGCQIFRSFRRSPENSEGSR